MEKMAGCTTSLLITIVSILIAFSSSFRPSEAAACACGTSEAEAAACGNAIYWGRNASEGSLSSTCATGLYKYVHLAFLTKFGGGQTPVLDLSDHCDASSGGCRGLSEEIRYCQSLDIKVQLAIGSALGSYLISSPHDARVVADYLWNNYLSGNPKGPLGDACLDGIDFVIEAPQSTLYWDDLAKDVSSFSTVHRKIFMTAAPQCNRSTPYWEAVLGTGVFDVVLVQFFNNETCDYTGGSKTLFKSWNEWSHSLPAGAKLLLGLPANPRAPEINSGYIPPAILIDEIFPKIKRSPNYGGMWLWNRYGDVLNAYTARAKKYVCRNVPRIKMVSDN